MSDVADHSDEARYDLVMPFVVCQSKGGPYADGAYVAGYEMGLLDHALGLPSDLPAGWRQFRQMIHTPNRPQADLIALKHGFSCR